MLIPIISIILIVFGMTQDTHSILLAVLVGLAAGVGAPIVLLLVESECQ